VGRETPVGDNPRMDRVRIEERSLNGPELVVLDQATGCLDLIDEVCTTRSP
jgi:hypothetical protein